MKATTSTVAGRGSLLGLLGWLLPLLVAIATGLWLASRQPDEDSRRTARARDDIRALTAALLAPGGLPDSRDGLARLVADGRLPTIPLDPWGRPYRYLHPGNVRVWELYSLGADGVESADDIVSWNLYGGR